MYLTVQHFNTVPIVTLEMIKKFYYSFEEFLGGIVFSTLIYVYMCESNSVISCNCIYLDLLQLFHLLNSNTLSVSGQTK